MRRRDANIQELTQPANLQTVGVAPSLLVAGGHANSLPLGQTSSVSLNVDFSFLSFAGGWSRRTQTFSERVTSDVLPTNL